MCDEAKELEMEKERYVQDLHQALTGTESSITYSFILAPASSSATVTLAYEKVQKDISVSTNMSDTPTPVFSLCTVITGMKRYCMC